MEKRVRGLKNAVVVLSIITILEFLIIILNVFILPNSNETIQQTIDALNYSDSKLVSMFEKEGYNIKFMNIDECIYILLQNKENGITIQRIPQTLVGPLMTFRNKCINNEMADLLVLSNNDTTEKQLQYKNYQEWLKNYNLSTAQITEMLEDYYDKNKNDKDKIEIINTQELLESSNY